MPTLPLLPHELLWSSFPSSQTLWVIRRQSTIATYVQWHTLLPGVAAARNDRTQWIMLHVDHTPLPSWNAILSAFPTLKEWTTEDHWNFLIAQWTAAAHNQPIPLWPDTPDLSSSSSPTPPSTRKEARREDVSLH